MTRAHTALDAEDSATALHELNEAIPTETEKFQRATAALKRVEAKLQQKETELSATEKKIRQLREQLAGSAQSQAESFLAT